MPSMTTGSPDEYERRITSGAIGAFGTYVMSQAYDEAIRDTQLVLSGNAAGPKGRRLHERLKALSDDQRQAAAELARDAVMSALHGLLRGLSHDADQIRLLFRGEDVAQASDGLHGDLFVWIRDLSEFPYDWEHE